MFDMGMLLICRFRQNLNEFNSCITYKLYNIIIIVVTFLGTIICQTCLQSDECDNHVDVYSNILKLKHKQNIISFKIICCLIL